MRMHGFKIKRLVTWLALSYGVISSLLPDAIAYAQTRPTQRELISRAEKEEKSLRWAEAAALWEQVVISNPTMADFWGRLGDAHRQAKAYRKAIPAFEKALSLGDGYPFDSAYNIASCYALLEDKAQALLWIERSLDLGLRNLYKLRSDPSFNFLHDDAKFIKLIAGDDVKALPRDEGWRYDLNFFARELKRIHYNPFKKISREEFESYVQKLHDEIPRLNDPQIETRLMKLARMIGDGHTNIIPSVFEPQWRLATPVEFYNFTEGVFIISASLKYADLLGAQVLEIGNQPVEQAIESLDQIISQDNKMGAKGIAMMFLRRPRLLYGLGLVSSPEKLTIKIRNAEGAILERTLIPELGEPTDNWQDVRQKSGVPEPLYLKNKRAKYWFESLPDLKLVYFQYNAVAEDQRESLSQFCDRLFKYINEHNVERLVIDLRFNNGGNNFLNRPLLEGLIRNDKINQPGKLFVIIGRQTFSAAMCAAAEIERYTEAIFVGEPTGSSPNFVGETTRVTLPWSKMTGSVSNLYWQNSYAMDYRVWIAPNLYAPPSFEMYRMNRDMAMEAILAYKHTE